MQAARRYGRRLLVSTLSVGLLRVGCFPGESSNRARSRPRRKGKTPSSEKNYRPPHPIGVKGGCSPQNNRENFEATKRALTQSQQICAKKFSRLSTALTVTSREKTNHRKTRKRSGNARAWRRSRKRVNEFGL